MNIFQKTWRGIQRLPRLYSIGGAIVIVVGVIFVVHVATRAPATATVAPSISHVQLASVSSLSSQTGPLPVTGTVTSLSDATILAQSSGEIVTLSHALGDQVAAGDVIAEFENSSEQASVLQAQGAYAAAEANLTTVSGSTAANSGIAAGQASQGEQNAQVAAVAALQSAAAAFDDAVHTKSDVLFSNPNSSLPTLLSFTIPDSQLVLNVQSERGNLATVLSAADALTSTSTGSVDLNITEMSSNGQTVLAFLDDLVEAMNEAVPNTQYSASTIATYQASVGAARSEVLTTLTGLTSAKSAYDAAQSGAQTAANSAGSADSSNIAAAQANVEEALGALDAAKANLEKTIVRSPISGTIVSLPITQGDYVSSFATVAQVSNPGALEIDTYVTPDDAKTLSVGSKATIDTSATGVITFIAPAIDPTTGEIEVKLGITGGQSTLTDGEVVTVSLNRSTASVSTGSATSNTASITIPIVAAKITPEGPVVFTVSSSTLVSNPITLGTILGDQVEVVSGLTPEMDIVTDARGLSNGQAVIVDSQ